MTKLSTIEGIGESYGKKLEAIGIKSTEDLLKRCASPQGRKEVAKQSGISDKQILRWANHTDLFRIKGVSGEYAELLEAAGVDTVPELAQRKADNLAKKFHEVNEAKKLVRKLPNANQVSGWINQAKGLPKIILY